jgi:outer membrane PBP1 activator LpoA protein
MMNLKRLSLTVALSALIAGCAMPPMQSPDVVDRSGNTNTQQSGMQMPVESLIDQANSAPPIQSAQLKLEAAKQLIARGEEDHALSLLDGIDTDILPPALRFDILSLQTQRAIQANDAERALSYLAYMPSLSTLPEEDVLLSEQLYADAFNLNGQALEEAKILIESTRYVHDEAQLQAYHDQIWAALQQLNNQELYQELQQPNNDYILQGWLELAQSARQVIDVRTSETNIDNWLAVWQAHPAAQIMPQDLITGGSANIENVARIGILLPQSGALENAGSAITEGILKAQANAQANGFTPEIVFIDSAPLNTAEEILSAVTNQGLEMIIGPLDKDKVNALANYNELPLPFLALNYADTSAFNLYQFGLSAEDEARDAATTAINAGKYSALVIAPDSDWGRRAHTAFTNTFTELGGSVADSLLFDSSKLSQQIPQLLRVDIGRLRANEARRRKKQSYSFANVRRNDADVILLAARPQDARLIKPFLKFYFANNIPVYATSQVYGGSPDPKADIDLNGVMFGDIPWILSPPSALQRSIASTKNNTQTRYGRLYALGADAYNLYPYLQELSMTPGAQLNGETGQLSVNSNNKVMRHLQWAVFKQGIPVLME